MVGIPAPAIVGKSLLKDGTPGASVVVEATEPPEVVEAVLSAEEEESVVDASVDDAVVLLEVDFAVVEVASSVWSLRFGRSEVFWAYAIGAPARASSASSCVFFAMRTMFAVPCLSNERSRRGCCGVTRRSSICAVASVRLFVSSLFPSLPVSKCPTLFVGGE